MGREIRSYLLRSAGFFVVLEVMLAAAIVWWPSFAENIGSIKNLASPLPMLRDMVDSLEQGGINAYVIGQHYFKGCNTLGATSAVLFAMGAVAGEAHRGTLELWIARPVSRARLLTERFVLGWLATALPVFASSATVPWLLQRVDETMAWNDLLLCSLHQSLFLGCIYTVTFVLSCASSQPIRIAFVMLFLSIFQFAIYMVKTITDWSLFRLVDIEVFTRITLRDGLLTGPTAAFVAVHVLGYLLALRLFARRVP